MFLEIMVLLFSIAAVLSSFIVIKSKNKWERLLGVGMVSAKIQMIIIVYALIFERTYFLDIALVYVILGYIGVNVLAEFMVERGNN